MIDPTEADIGRKVVYYDAGRDLREEGVISSFNERYVFVRYGEAYGQATAREDLSWSFPAASPPQNKAVGGGT